MKIYGILLLVFVLGIVAGCAQTAPVNTAGNNVPTQENTQATGNNEQTQAPITNEQPAVNEPPANVEPVPPANTEPSGISLSELSSHNERADCWVGYKGKVYDITDFIPKHPGGASKITPYCGTSSEFEKAFTRQHGTSQVSNMIKQTTYIGDLQ